MNLYELIAANTAALIANTAALNAAKGGAAAATESTTAEKTTTAAKGTKGKGTAPKGPTREEVNALVNKVKEELGATEAKGLIAQTGAAKLAEVPDAKLAELFKLATDALAGGEEGEAEDDGI